MFTVCKLENDIEIVDLTLVMFHMFVYQRVSIHSIVSLVSGCLLYQGVWDDIIYPFSSQDNERISIPHFYVENLMFSLSVGRWGHRTTVGHPRMRKTPLVSVLELIYVQWFWGHFKKPCKPSRVGSFLCGFHGDLTYLRICHMCVICIYCKVHREILNPR